MTDEGVNKERDPLTWPSPTAECSQAISTIASRSKATNWDQAIRVTGHGPAAEEIISLTSCLLKDSNLPASSRPIFSSLIY